MNKDYILFSSIGLMQTTRNGKIDYSHPIKQIASEHSKIRNVCLFSSNERPSKDVLYRSTDLNIQDIQLFFEGIGAGIISVEDIRLQMEHFQKNMFEIATKIIEVHRKFPKCNIILDLSTGRNAIKLALSRAGEIANDYFENLEDRPTIICALRPEAYPDVISYKLKNLPIPNSKDQVLLDHIKKNRKWTSQVTIASRIGWKNQGEVSKSLSRLTKYDYFDKKNMKITDDGRDISGFLETLNN